MNFKALLASLVLTTTTMPVVADVTYENKDQIDDHIELLNTLEGMGVNVNINSYHCRNEDGVAGYWHGGKNLFVLCQEALRTSKLPSWDGEVYLASDDDLDTIRHEAHHVIQDCMDGKVDGRLETYMSDTDRAKFLSYYPDWKEEHIAKQYRATGANEHVITLEIEAWAVADMVSADAINDALKRVCKV